MSPLPVLERAMARCGDRVRGPAATYTVDPARVGGPCGTPAEADWLYPDEVLTGMMTALVKHGTAPKEA